uniref:Putative secreted protein n=1 Tax=Anopheles darlingi TaxID=43151 RepID=A0A2M4D4I4_ANODA
MRVLRFLNRTGPCLTVFLLIGSTLIIYAQSSRTPDFYSMLIRERFESNRFMMTTCPRVVPAVRTRSDRLSLFCLQIGRTRRNSHSLTDRERENGLICGNVVGLVGVTLLCYSSRSFPDANCMVVAMFAFCDCLKLMLPCFAPRFYGHKR